MSGRGRGAGGPGGASTKGSASGAGPTPAADPRGALTRLPAPGGDYEVGYGRPPVSTRFSKGRSGNPKGRPRGAKNKVPALNEERLKSILLAEAYREVTVRDGDRNVTVPMAQAVIRSLAVLAAKGQHRAQRLFAELLSHTERANRALHNEWLDVAMTYKIEWERELDRRARLGLTGLPEPLPHPDHVRIDLRKGTAAVVGPATREEKAEWDLWQSRKREFEEEADELAEMIEAEQDPERRAFLEADRAQTVKVIEIIEKGLGG